MFENIHKLFFPRHTKYDKIRWPLNKNKQDTTLCQCRNVFLYENQKTPIRKGFPGCNEVPCLLSVTYCVPEVPCPGVLLVETTPAGWMDVR